MSIQGMGLRLQIREVLRIRLGNRFRNFIYIEDNYDKCEYNNVG